MTGIDRAVVAVVAARRQSAHAASPRAGVGRRAGVTVIAGQTVVAVHATAGGITSVVGAPVTIVAVNQPRHELAADPGRTAVGGAGVGVITSRGSASHAGSNIALVAAGAGISIIASRVVGKVGATAGRVADVIGADVAVAAVQRRALANAGRTAGVAGGADASVIAGADFSRAISSTAVAGCVVAVVAGLASLDDTVAAFGSHYQGSTKRVYRQ